jgi:hypothetical protein
MAMDTFSVARDELTLGTTHPVVERSNRDRTRGARCLVGASRLDRRDDPGHNPLVEDLRRTTATPGRGAPVFGARFDVLDGPVRTTHELNRTRLVMPV